MADRYEVQTSGSPFSVWRYGDDGAAKVHMTFDRLEAMRMADELNRAAKRESLRAIEAAYVAGYNAACERFRETEPVTPDRIEVLENEEDPSR